jgi:hypothetical protein
MNQALALLLTASFCWLMNTGFGLWRAFDDLAVGKRGQAALGTACVLGVNAVLGWVIYIAISTSTDF